ncbi:MAG: hypothetical protein Q4C42_05030 [Clostridia bacterium]|nr:hypothetical protein [Clostridia bacterium]
MRSDEFVDLYKKFEDALEARYAQKKRRYTSVIYEFLNDNESLPVRENVNTCREIRNLLAHNAKISGQAVVEPSEAVTEILRDLVEYVNKPPLAIDFASRGDSIYKANLGQTVLKTMNNMVKSGYSHVPIMENGKFFGVFSAGTVFSYVLNNYPEPITKNTTLRELNNLLPVNMHSENYVFADAKMTLHEAREAFESVKAKNRRVSVIFITQHGRQDEPLLGLLTPWDVLGGEDR